MIASAESSTGGFSDKIIAENGLAFLGNGPDGVDCFDIGSGTQPIFLSSIDTTGTVKGLSFDPPYLAVANADLGVAVIDYTDPANPKLLHTHPTHSPANCVSLVGSILFVGLHSGEVISMDAMMGHQIDHLSFAEEKHHRSLDDLVFYQDTLYALIDAPMYRTWGSYLSFFHALTVKNGFFGDINGEFSQNYRHQLYGYRPYKAGRRLFIADGYAYVSYIRVLIISPLCKNQPLPKIMIPTPLAGAASSAMARAWLFPSKHPIPRSLPTLAFTP